MTEILTGRTGKRVAGRSAHRPSRPDRPAHDAESGTNRRRGKIKAPGMRMVHTATSQLASQVVRSDAGGIFGGRR